MTTAPENVRFRLTVGRAITALRWMASRTPNPNHQNAYATSAARFEFGIIHPSLDVKLPTDPNHRLTVDEVVDRLNQAAQLSKNAERHEGYLRAAARFRDGRWKNAFAKV